MSNLVPQKRPDKNGRLVTRHVKADISSPAARAAVPPPSVAVTAVPKPNKLLPRQTQVVRRDIARVGKEPHQEVKDALSFDSKHGLFTVNASDAELYNAFSVADVGDALLLMQSGYQSKDEIVGFLHDNGLDRLVVDRQHMMDDALQRRIDPAKLATFHSAYDMNLYDPEVFVDSVEAYSSGTLNSLNMNIPRDILNGDMSIADIKAVGISRIHKSNAAVEVLNTLRSVHQGSIDCTADDVRKIIDTHTADNTHSESLKWALSAVYEHGGSFIGSLKSLSRNHRLLQDLKLDKFGPKALTDRRQKVLEYNDKLLKEGAYLSSRDFITVYRSGMDANEAGRLWASGLKNVNQLVATHTEDVPASVASGWL